MLTTFDSDANIAAALRAGANGFLLKDTPPRQIVDAVLTPQAGSRSCHPRSPAG